MRKWWKNPYFIGSAAYCVLKSLSKSLQYKIAIDPTIDATQPYLFAFWHGKQLLPSFILHKYHKTPMCAMVSPSRDGGILSIYLEKCGFEVVRGSSRANNIAVLFNMKKKLQSGTAVGFGIDGPIGPLHVVKPGIVYLAQKCNLPIIPMGSAFNSAWTFAKAWDKFQVPKPFAKAGLVLGQPYVVCKDLDVDKACLELATKLHAVEQHATDLILN